MKKLFVLIAAVAFVAAFAAPSFAAEWSFYGHARMTTFWVDQDFGDYVGPSGADDDFDLIHDLQGNTRIGAKVKVSDNLTGQFEYGITTSAVNSRLIYGVYDFGGFKLKVGQDYIPTNFFISNQVCPVLGGGDDNLLPYGGFYFGRRPEIAGIFGGLEVALVRAEAPAVLGYPGVDTDVTLPMLAAKYSFKVAGLSLQVAGGYQTYKVVDANDDDEDVNSYVGGIAATYNMGPFMLGGNYWMGRNVGNMWKWDAGYADAVYDPVDEDMLDNDGWGFIIVGAFTASDMLRFEAGYGFSSFDIDEAPTEDETSSMYLQAKITFAKGVFIVPEVGVIDLKDDPGEGDQGDITYYGLQWQIRF